MPLAKRSHPPYSIHVDNRSVGVALSRRYSVNSFESQEALATAEPCASGAAGIDYSRWQLHAGQVSRLLGAVLGQHTVLDGQHAPLDSAIWRIVEAPLPWAIDGHGSSRLAGEDALAEPADCVVVVIKNALVAVAITYVGRAAGGAPPEVAEQVLEVAETRARVRARGARLERDGVAGLLRMGMGGYLGPGAGGLVRGLRAGQGNHHCWQDSRCHRWGGHQRSPVAPERRKRSLARNGNGVRPREGKPASVRETIRSQVLGNGTALVAAVPQPGWLSWETRWTAFRCQRLV